MNLRFSRSLTLVLAGFVALMLLLILLFWFGVGRGYSWWPLDPLDPAAGKRQFSNAQFRLGGWDKFAEVNARPLFNEDRKPTPPMPAEASGPEKPIPHLDVVLSGVIITSKVRLAMVKEKGKEKSMTVKEGGAMPGEWSAWNLVELKPRSAVFKNSMGESATVELTPVAITQKPTPPPVPRTTDAAPAPPVGQVPAPGQPPPQPGQAPPMLPAPGTAPAPETAAADLQHRIDARRQQIREQQERPVAQPQSQQQ